MELLLKTKFCKILFDKFGYVDARFLKINPNTIYNWHIDKGRKCAINFPVVNNKKAITLFKQYEKREHIFSCYEVDYTDFRPTILDTTYPHCIINSWPEERIMLTVSTHKDCSYEEVKSFLETLK